MAGIHELGRLLCEMDPILRDGFYVFTTCDADDVELARWASSRALATFRESEGLSVVVERSAARERGLPFEGLYRWITLQVHSDLEAVGLTAAVADALTRAQIPANVVAAHYHDHVFVPAASADRALEVLQQLSEAANRR